MNEVNEVNGEFGESDEKRIPAKETMIKNVLYNNVRAKPSMSILLHISFLLVTFAVFCIPNSHSHSHLGIIM